MVPVRPDRESPELKLSSQALTIGFVKGHTFRAELPSGHRAHFPERTISVAGHGVLYPDVTEIQEIEKQCLLPCKLASATAMSRRRLHL